MGSDTLVKIRGLRFARGNRPIFDGVDLDIPRGKVTAIMGPSGTGKTTLLRLIGGQLHPDQGSIQVDGQEVPELRRSALYALRQRMGTNGQAYVQANYTWPIIEHKYLHFLEQLKTDTLLKLKTDS